MTRTNPSTWAKRLAAVFGASLVSFALVTTTAATAATNYTPNLKKAPKEAHWMDFHFGTNGFDAIATVPGVDINGEDPNVQDWVLGGTEVPVRIKTKGFGKGPLTVWIQSSGNVEGVGLTPWRKFTVTPDNKGNVTVNIKPTKNDHCSAVWIRVNDKQGNWTEESISLKVKDEAPCATCTPAE